MILDSAVVSSAILQFGLKVQELKNRGGELFRSV